MCSSEEDEIHSQEESHPEEKRNPEEDETHPERTWVVHRKT